MKKGLAQIIKAIVMFLKAVKSSFSPETDRGTVICNPPYGERLLDKEQAEELYRIMGKCFPKQRGWSYNIITPDDGFEKLFGRKADKSRKIYNGMIKCRYYMYFKND